MDFELPPDDDPRRTEVRAWLAANHTRPTGAWVVMDRRATEAAMQAVSSPLLETSMEGARSILLSITAGTNLSLWEVNEAAKRPVCIGCGRVEENAGHRCGSLPGSIDALPDAGRIVAARQGQFTDQEMGKGVQHRIADTGVT